MKMVNKDIGKGGSVFIIAELSANHNQSFSLAVKTIRAMKKAGADAVKIQTYTPDTITINSREELFFNGVFFINQYKCSEMTTCNLRNENRSIYCRSTGKSRI